MKDTYFSYQDNPKNPDPSCKKDLDLWDRLGKVNLVLLQNFTGLIYFFFVLLERGKPLLIAKFIQYKRQLFSSSELKSPGELIGYRISLVKRQSFSFPKQTKHLDPSFKTDLDLWGCFGRKKKTRNKSKSGRTDLVIL